MGVDRHELHTLIRDLGEIPPAVRKELKPAINRAGSLVLGQMRVNSEWSSRIPGAISMRPAPTTIGVTFRVSSARAPHARPYEHDGVQGVFRAPLWGDREYWYDHRARPFFYRALYLRTEQVMAELGKAVEDAAARHGF